MEHSGVLDLQIIAIGDRLSRGLMNHRLAFEVVYLRNLGLVKLDWIVTVLVAFTLIIDNIGEGW